MPLSSKKCTFLKNLKVYLCLYFEVFSNNFMITEVEFISFRHQLFKQKLNRNDRRTRGNIVLKINRGPKNSEIFEASVVLVNI